MFRSPLDRPVVCALRMPEERRFALPTDMTIALPEVTFRDGRPAWRQARGQRPVAIPPELRCSQYWTIVEVRHAAEPDEAVPADRLLVGPGETLPLLLPPGHFRVEAWTREAGWTKSIPITVP